MNHIETWSDFSKNGVKGRMSGVVKSLIQIVSYCILVKVAFRLIEVE